MWQTVREAFGVYVQALVSGWMDETFLQDLATTPGMYRTASACVELFPDDYFSPALHVVNKAVHDVKTLAVSSSVWRHPFQRAMCHYPTMTASDPQLDSLRTTVLCRQS